VVSPKSCLTITRNYHLIPVMQQIADAAGEKANDYKDKWTRSLVNE